MQCAPTGLYRYEIDHGIYTRQGGKYVPALGSPRRTTERMAVVNAIESPFGAGWALSGLAQLYVETDGYALLVDGDGTFRSPREFTLGFAPGSLAVGELDGDVDLMTANAGAGASVRLNGLIQPDGSTMGLIPTTVATKSQTLYDPKFALPAEILDALNRKIGVTRDARGNATVYEYDVMGNLKSVVDRRGVKTEYAYDKAGRLTDVTKAAGTPLASTISYGYDAAGNATLVTYPMDRKVFYVYDDLNRVDYEIRAYHTADAQKWDYGYDFEGNRTSVTDPRLKTTSYGYDELSRQTTVTDPYGHSVTTLYDPVGNVVSTTDQDGLTTVYSYDKIDRRLTEQVGTLPPSTCTYDVVGENRVIATDPMGSPMETVFDALGRVDWIHYADDGVLDYGCDALGNLVTLVDPAGNNSIFGYDKLNRRVSETDQVARTRSYGYDEEGNLTSLTDRNGRTREFVYDALGRMTLERWLGEGARTIGYSYNAASDLVSVTDVDSTYAYSYDNLARVTGISNAGTPGMPEVSTGYTYDSGGNVRFARYEINGAHYATNEYVYDNVNRTAWVLQSGPGVAEKRVNFEWTGAGRADAISRYIVSSGSPVLVAATDFQYDPLQRLSNLTHASSTGQIDSYTFTYDNNNRITQIQDVDGTRSYGYDDTNRLNSAQYPDPAWNESYVYDAAGNRTGDGYQTNGENELLADGTYTCDYDSEGNLIRRTETATGKVREFTWDHRNRLVRVEDRDSSGGALTMVAQYTYDASDRRIATSVDTTPGDAIGPTVTRFVWDRDHVVLQFGDEDGATFEVRRAEDEAIAQGDDTTTVFRGAFLNNHVQPGTVTIVAGAHFFSDAGDGRLASPSGATGTMNYAAGEWTLDFGSTVPAAGTPIMADYDYLVQTGGAAFDPAIALTYLYGPGTDQILAQDEGAGNVLWHLGDQVGSVRDLVDNSGNLLQHIPYDAFGNIMLPSGLVLPTRMLFTGREYDAETGMYYYRARYYDPLPGRFISQDPLRFKQADPNLYVYADNAPLTATDPLGLFAAPRNSPRGKLHALPRRVAADGIAVAGRELVHG